MVAHQQHFATKVLERRKKLGMTFLDLHRSGGPTAPTVAKAEAGTLADPRPSTLSKFDVGLRWIPGSAAGAYWDGDEPEPREEIAKRTVLKPSPGAIAVSLDQILALMGTQAQLNDLIDDGCEDVITLAEIRPIARELNQHVSAIVGRFVTDLLERNHSENGQTIQPLLEYALAELLSPAVGTEDPERNKKLYRRWLLGKTQDLDAGLEASFRRQLGRSSQPREEDMN